MKMRLPLACALALVAVPLLAQQNPAPHPTATLNLVVNNQVRRVMVELYPDKAPQTVANFENLIRNGYYKGLAVHRVIPKYLVQMGDPYTRDDSQKHLWGTGGPDHTLPSEIDLPIIRGSLAMARLPDASNPKKESNGSQFFIALENLDHLKGQYTVFGRVVSGIEHIDFIAEQTVDTNDVPIHRVDIGGIALSSGGGDGDGISVASVAEGAGQAMRGATHSVANVLPDKMPEFSMPRMPKIPTPSLPKLGGKKEEEVTDAAAPPALEGTAEEKDRKFHIPLIGARRDSALEEPAPAVMETAEEKERKMNLPFVGGKKNELQQVSSFPERDPVSSQSQPPSMSVFGPQGTAPAPPQTLSQTQSPAPAPAPEAAPETPKVKEGESGRQFLSLPAPEKKEEEKKGIFGRVIQRVW